MFGKLHLANHIRPLYVFINKVVLNTTLFICRASLLTQRLTRLPAMRETWVRSLGWEDPLEKEMATHSSILAWRIPWTTWDSVASWATVHVVAKSQTWLNGFTFFLCSFVSISFMVAFAQQWQNWTVATDKMVCKTWCITIWPFIEKVCWTLA